MPEEETKSELVLSALAKVAELMALGVVAVSAVLGAWDRVAGSMLVAIYLNIASRPQ